MKLQKLSVIAGTGCLLLGASGTAMAVDCPNGFIVGQQVDEIVINGQPCHIEEVQVAGDVTVTDSPDLDMIDVEVQGGVTVNGGGECHP